MSDSNAFAPGYMMNKKVVVSGGTSGIGLAIARGFAEAGADVTATGSSTARLSAAELEASAKLRFQKLDVRDGEAVQTSLRALAACMYSLTVRAWQGQTRNGRKTLSSMLWISTSTV